jgi:hypothetical protein
MCTVLLPPGVNPIAVNKYIKYQIEDTDTHGNNIETKCRRFFPEKLTVP